MPSLDAANTAFNLANVLAEGLPVGPMLLGVRHAAHIVSPSVTARGLVDNTALAVVDAQSLQRGDGTA
jgi:malate dehydrogenase (oxaloacetate-decarboxylating)(NADP+)